MSLLDCWQSRLLPKSLLLVLSLVFTTLQAAAPPPTTAAEQLRLGERYAYGHGVRQDDQKAAELFRLAAEQGNAEAQYKLAVTLERGMGVPRDDAGALHWYGQAARQGHAGAQNNMGSLYEKGRGVPADMAQAVQWYRLAAAQGLAHANYNLGMAYWQGRGVEQDLELAVQHFELAERKGLREAADKRMQIEQEQRQLAACGPTPEEFHSLPYSDAMYAIMLPCHRALPLNEQLFLAGLSNHFLEQCGYPQGLDARIQLQKFITSMTLMVSPGAGYANPNPLNAIGDQISNTAIFASGGSTAQSIGCSQIGERLADRIVSYLDRTSAGAVDTPNYVNGCVQHYGGTYTRSQCQCVADIGRAIHPDIHQTAFSTSSIKSIIASNPFLGLQIGLQCGIGDY